MHKTMCSFSRTLYESRIENKKYTILNLFIGFLKFLKIYALEVKYYENK